MLSIVLEKNKFIHSFFYFLNSEESIKSNENNICNNDGEADEDDCIDDINSYKEQLQIDEVKKHNMLYVHQEKWQMDLLKKYGSKIALMDATYKTTKYTVPLYFVCVLTNSGYQIIGMICCKPVSVI